MNKIIILLLILFFVPSVVFADVIYNSKGATITGEIEGVTDGLIQIKNNGNLVTLIRREPSPVYKDSVDVRKRFISKQKIKYVGTLIYADNKTLKILCEDVKVVIPRYRVNNIEMFVP